MKSFSSGLLAFLANNPSYNRADLFAITCGTPQNLLAWSQNFEKSATWISSGAVTVTPNSQLAPNALMVADTIAFGSAGVGVFNEIVQITTGVAAIGQAVTFSVWLKAASPVTVWLRSDSGTPQNDTVVNVTTTWQRFAINVTPTAGTTFHTYIYITNQGATTIYAWGAQLEIAPTMGIYLQTFGAAQGDIAPRRVIYATSAQIDITIQGVTFYASKYGAWQRGKVTSEASFGLHSNSMALTVLAPASVPFLNTNLSFMSAALAGLFDAALVQVSTAYWPLNMQPNAYLVPNPYPSNSPFDIENKFTGYILPDGQISRSKIEFSVADGLMMLNLKTPRNVIQASCRHTLYDANCTLNKASFASTNSVTTGSTTQSINTLTALGHAAPYYSQGFITFTSGQNAGLTYSIKAQLSTTNILLSSKTLLPVTLGDTFTIYAGCDKTTATCQGRFANLIHFGGQPFVPNPEVAI